MLVYIAIIAGIFRAMGKFEEIAQTGEPPIFFLVIAYTPILAFIIPSIAVSVRRLHDIGKSGWWYLISFFPYIVVFFY